MATGFTFGASTPQQPPPFGAAITPIQQQTPTFGAGLPQSTPQQPQFGVANPNPVQTPSLFGTVAPLATSTPATFGTATSAAPSLFGTNPATTSTGFSFATPAPAQQQPQSTGFGFGGGLGVPAATSANTTGLSFGTPAAGSTFVLGAAPTQLPTVSAAPPPTGGLGGIPSSIAPRISSLALGGEAIPTWPAPGRIGDTRICQEQPVPPELLAAVEELKNQMAAQKRILGEICRKEEFDVDSVADQIEEAKAGISQLINNMHKQELQTAVLVKEVQELNKDLDLITQARDVPSSSYGGANFLLNYMYDLAGKYAKRIEGFRVEIDRAEEALQTLVAGSTPNIKDLWDSLASTKNTIVCMAAQLQEIQEKLRTELNVHKNIGQVIFGVGPSQWLAEALAGNRNLDDAISPLERAFASQYKKLIKPGTTPAESFSMLGRPSALVDSRILASAASTDNIFKTPSHPEHRSITYSHSPSYHPSAIGSYLGPSSPAISPGNKRTKK